MLLMSEDFLNLFFASLVGRYPFTRALGFSVDDIGFNTLGYFGIMRSRLGTRVLGSSVFHANWKDLALTACGMLVLILSSGQESNTSGTSTLLLHTCFRGLPFFS